MYQKFEHTGSISDALCNGCLRDACTEKNVHAVVEESTQSAQRGARELDLSRLVLYNKNCVMQKKGTFFFPIANLDSNFCTTP